MLDYTELEELMDDIRAKVSLANRTGTLDDILRALGMDSWLQPTNTFESYRNGKIVVIGASTVKEEELRMVARKAGIDGSRLEFCLDYNAAQTYPYRKLQYAPAYRVVMFGPIPHSSTGKGEAGSVIANMENEDGYPRVVRLISGSELKITKNSFKEALSRLQEEGYIA